jgi:hypothetical protein
MQHQFYLSLCRLFYSNYLIYEGEYLNGLPHGKGKYIWSNKNQYVGEFKNGKIEGQGVYTENGVEYKGEFVNGKFRGKNSHRINYLNNFKKKLE